MAAVGEPRGEELPGGKRSEGLGGEDNRSVKRAEGLWEGHGVSPGPPAWQGSASVCGMPDGRPVEEDYGGLFAGSIPGKGGFSLSSCPWDRSISPFAPLTRGPSAL